MSVVLPHPLGADKTMNKGFVFIQMHHIIPYLTPPRKRQPKCTPTPAAVLPRFPLVIQLRCGQMASANVSAFFEPSSNPNNSQTPNLINSSRLPSANESGVVRRSSLLGSELNLLSFAQSRGVVSGSGDGSDERKRSEGLSESVCVKSLMEDAAELMLSIMLLMPVRWHSRRMLTLRVKSAAL